MGKMMESKASGIGRAFAGASGNRGFTAGLSALLLLAGNPLVARADLPVPPQETISFPPTLRASSPEPEPGAPGSPFAVPGVAHSTQEWSPEQREVWAEVEELWRLSSALEIDGWFNRVSEAYRGWSIRDERPRGKATWREEAQSRFSGPRRVHYRLVPRAVDVHGDVALAYYHYSAVTRSPAGALSTSRGQWTDVFQREGRDWKLLADAGGETRFDADLLVSTDWLSDRLADPGLVLIQVESQEERYADGHIPGARFLPFAGIAWEGQEEQGTELLDPEEIRRTLEALGVGDEDHIVVYGSHPLLAARLWLTLDILGMGEKRSLLDGGLPAWVEEGRPLSTEVPESAPPASLTLRPTREVLVDAEWVLANLEDPAVALVDARYEEEYTGEGQETEPVGHIPGAGSAPWVDLIRSREVFRLRPIEELAATLSGADVGPGDTVVPYCIIGLRASLDYFVARLLGYETRFYDGSWRDWTNRGLPLVEGATPR